MNISIEYCSQRGYAPECVGLTERLLEEFEQQISDLTLIPSRGGVFEVTVDDELLYSKKATGRHAEHDEILAQLRKRVS